MDWVDRWLNGQRGWRRLLLAWLVLAPLLLDYGLLWSAHGNIGKRANVPTGSVLVHVAIIAVAGIPLAAAVGWLDRWSRKSRPWAPGLSWRMIAALYVFAASMGADAYGMTRTLVWRNQHLPAKVLLLADAVAGVLFIWNLVYYWKLRRRADADAQPAAR